MEPHVDLAALQTAATRWRSRSHGDLADLVAACRRNVDVAADAWVAASVAAKGWADVPHSGAEEWCSGPLPVARFLACLERLHRGLAQGRLPTVRAVQPTAGTPIAFAALPAVGPLDRVVLAGHRARIDCDDAERREPARCGDVALVLGAGNVTATPLLDVLDQVFLHGRAVLLKASPLHAPLVARFSAALAPLVTAGLCRIVVGDGEFGARMARDPAIAAVHLTGSGTTWQHLRTDPVLTAKVLTAEVGCCTPVLVPPFEFAAGELLRVARQLAAYVAMNGGATCLAPRLLLTARNWPQRDALLHLLRTELAALPPRVPFHPGAHAAFAAANGGTSVTGPLQATLRCDLDAERDAACFTEEHFAPVLCELPLAGRDLEYWLARATAFVRERVHGALSAYVFAPPSALRRHASALDAAIAGLPHGTIAINGWTGLGFGLGTTPWGVPAGTAPTHGRGFARSTLCLAAPRRVVVTAPLRPWPLPPWLPSHTSGAAAARALLRLSLRPSPTRLFAAAMHALPRP